ncbi:MAG: protein kinase [Deltaproteobacteria bacterium]|nr:protein kinase [Deltaproteobacteria bacterium]
MLGATSHDDETITERYELLELAGAGGMGEVYRARDRATGEIVALKILASPSGGERFDREAAALASLDHPGIVRYRGHGTTPRGTKYLAMEWLVGHDLEDRLARAPLTPAETLVLGKRVADALGAAHVRDLVHRDLKPANLFLVGGSIDDVRIVDFGLARGLDDPTLTAPGMVVGTPAYMAPEQVRGDPVDARADVYALGAVLFRCLTGRPPFGGTHPIAVLAKVLVEHAPSVRELRPGTRAGLDALVTRMLAKAPSARPASGADVLAALTTIEAAEATDDAPPSTIVTSTERRVATVVLCSVGANDVETLPSARRTTGEIDRVRATVQARGGSFDIIARGTWLVTIPSAATPTEQATRAARCALALSEARPTAAIVVATGRVIVTGAVQIGEVIDRATQALVAGRAEPGISRVRLDDATAALLDDRFEIQASAQAPASGAWAALVRERETLAPVRTLMGRPAPCVGRTQELAMLSSTLAACVEDGSARPVLVIAPAGLGKSRLVHELLRGLGTATSTRAVARADATPDPSRPDDVCVLFARGDPVRAGSPFGLVAQMLGRLAGMLDSDPAPTRVAKLRALVGADRRHVADMLGEACAARVPMAEASPALRAARADTSVMVDALREAWTEWIASITTERAALVIVEDLHWGDLSSVGLLDAALETLGDRPWMLLATARPELSLPRMDLWRRRGLQELHLGPLSAKAAERMAREALGDRLDPAVLADVMRRAAGHPFHLEELLRAVAEGRGAGDLPDSVIGMVQARLDLLGAGARRVLRAASVFGETFWSGGVSALLGDAEAREALPADLSLLVNEELLTRRPSSSIVGEIELSFRHGLVREGAYAMLTEQDRARAHRSAAEWLELKGMTDPAMLATHFDRGGLAARAGALYATAAAVAMEGNDFARAAHLTERALSCGPDRVTEGALWAIQAEVTYWGGGLPRAAELAEAAADRLSRGDARWYAAASVALGALGQRGMNDGVAAWLARVSDAPSDESTRSAQVVALCRGLLQLAWAHHPGETVAAVRRRVDALVGGPDARPSDAFEAGWVERVRAECAWLHDHDLDRCLASFDASAAAFEEARALRALCLVRANAASLSGFSGDIERGLALALSAERDAARLGSGFLASYAMCVRGMVLTFAGAREADDVMRRAVELVGSSPRLAYICRVVLAWHALERGDLDAADVHVGAALPLSVASELRPAARALSARLRLARGDLDGALLEARDAAVASAAHRDLELMEGLAGLVLADVHRARGEHAEATVALEAIRARLDAIAGTLRSADARARFWSRRFVNDRIGAPPSVPT